MKKFLGISSFLLWFKLESICSHSCEALGLEEHTELTARWFSDAPAPAWLLYSELLTHSSSNMLYSVNVMRWLHDV